MITCTHLSYAYTSDHPALNDLNLHIEPGEFVCVLGGNGSGKSSFLKHLNALLLPDTGEVFVLGYDTQDPRYTYEIRSHAGMVFQNPEDHLVASVVENDIAFGPENLNLASDEIRERVTEALSTVGLATYETQSTHALSGGQKQRLAIAGALAMRPQILLLDEASSMLDPQGRRELMKLCRELNSQGMTIVMVTHFMEEASQADRVIVLDQGRCALDGTPEEVFSHQEQLTNLHLSLPFASELSWKLSQGGLDLGFHTTMEELVEALDLGFRQLPNYSPDECTHVAAKNSYLGDNPDCTPSSAAKQAITPASAEEEPREVLISFEDVSYHYEPYAFKKAQPKKKLIKRSNSKETPKRDVTAPAWALQDIKLHIASGEFLGIAGHTGSGKSTLIQHMNGLLKPSTGRVLVKGHDISQKDKARLARSFVGLVFQYPEQQLFAQSVYEDVAFGPRNLGVPEEALMERVTEALAKTGLIPENFLEKNPFELSGGEQRKVALAGILAMRPEVLILDEPVAGLDPEGRKEFLQLVVDLHAAGQTIVMISHNMEDLAEVADRLIILHDGKIVADGKPRDIFLRREDLSSWGLELPVAQACADALREKGFPLSSTQLYSSESLCAALLSLKEELVCMS